MATDYHHGVRVIEINEGSRPIRTVSTAGTAPDEASGPTNPRAPPSRRRPRGAPLQPKIDLSDLDS